MTFCLNPACHQPQNLNVNQFCNSCGSKLLLADRYRAIELINKGITRTFLAQDEQKPCRSLCIIKQFSLENHNIKDPQLIAKLFDRAAIPLEKLGKHDRIPELLACLTQDGRQYLVQEYIEGNDLAWELQINGNFTAMQIESLLNDLLVVIDFIHSHQIIHRDIKPNKIICRREDNRFVILDCDTSVISTSISAIRLEEQIGSPEYISPEQAMGKAVFASDLYSLGVTCVHLLTGIHPFDLYSLTEGIQGWRDYLVDNSVSDRLHRILNKLIARNLRDRYHSATEVLRDLNSSLGQETNSQIQWIDYSIEWREMNF